MDLKNVYLVQNVSFELLLNDMFHNVTFLKKYKQKYIITFT